MKDVGISIFQPTDKSHFWPMLRSEFLQWRLNKTPLWNIPIRNWLVKRLFASIDGTAYCIQHPFHVSYGKNLYIGKNFFANYNCVIMDHAEIHIGDEVFLGPNVSILTVSHPFVPDERRIHHDENSFEPHKRGDFEIIAPVNIGNNVWIAACSIVCQGVSIGDNTVIGAGSIVTRDVPANVFACGSPCRVVREITEEDRLMNLESFIREDNNIDAKLNTVI